MDIIKLGLSTLLVAACSSPKTAPGDESPAKAPITPGASKSPPPASSPPPALDTPSLHGKQPELEKPQPTSNATLMLSGVYAELNVKQRQDGKPKYVGRAIVKLNSGYSYLLETGEAGIRSNEEIERFRGKNVQVEARTSGEHCTAWGDGTEASIVSPCLRGIVQISVLPKNAQ